MLRRVALPVREPDQIADWSELTSVDPDEGALLVHRLRLVAETLDVKFGGLSKAEAERLIFQMAREVLAGASVIQFVPTFAERRARQILQGGLPSSTRSSLDATTPEPEPARPSPSPAPRSEPAHPTSPPPWPDNYYDTEAKRLLEKARLLRAANSAARPEA